MLALLTTLHVAVALVLILVVLLQSARGTDLAGAFGGMGSQTAFGPRGTTTFLSKTTAALAATFMVTSLLLAILSNRSRGRGGSVLGGEKQSATKPQPVAPPARGQTNVPVTPVPPPSLPIPSGQPSGNPQQAAPPAQGQPNVTVTPVPPSTPPSSSGAPPAQGQPNEQATPVPPPKTSQ